MDTPTKPIIGGILFCNSTSPGEGGKINGLGFFTSFLAWSFPTSVRIWHAVLTLYDFKERSVEILCSVSVNNRRKIKLPTAKIDFKIQKDNYGLIIDIPLRHIFEQEGLHTFYFNIDKSNIFIRIPIMVSKLPWPQFNSKQLEFLKTDPSIPHSFRINFTCPKCSRPFIFEDSIFPDEKLADGVLAFPQSGLFDCESCETKLHLKDIQGQLRSSIKSNVVNFMRGGK